jgi:hypothetical protein
VQEILTEAKVDLEADFTWVIFAFFTLLDTQEKQMMEELAKEEFEATI